MDSSILNRWNVSWDTSVGAFKYDSVWRRPDGTSTTYANNEQTNRLYTKNKSYNHFGNFKFIFHKLWIK